MDPNSKYAELTSFPRGREDSQISVVPPEPRDSRIQEVIDTISPDYRRRIKVDEMALTTGLSTSHFAHLFRREVGVSPARFLHEIRLRRAEQLIRTTTLPLKKILILAGITERSHFIRAFKQRNNGLSPSRYRAQCRATPSSKPEPL